MQVGDLVMPRQEGWKKYRKSKGIIVDRLHWGMETAVVSWFSGDRNEWSLKELEVFSANR